MAERLRFLDGLRGVALILMVLNHTSRDWIDASLNPGRYYLVYGTVLLAAPIFLFLVGFCLPLSYRHAASRGGGWLGLVVKYGRRGVMIIGAGLLLNVLVFPEVPFWSGGVLQTIGLSIVLLGPTVPLADHAWARAALAAAAVLLYAGFVLAHPTLVAWSKAHAFLASIFFRGFPPFPWVGVALIGLVLGAVWLDARQHADGEERFFATVAVVGVVSVAAYHAWEWLRPSPAKFGFPRDLGLNGEWNPGGVTMLLVIGGVAAFLAAAYRVMHVRKREFRWLVVLGQTALVLYFVHQVIEMTLVSRVLGWRFAHWSSYWVANLVFLALLVVLGRTWLALKARIVGRSASLAGAPPRADRRDRAS